MLTNRSTIVNSRGGQSGLWHRLEIDRRRGFAGWSRWQSQGRSRCPDPGGFGDRGVEGKIRAARFARENKLPYLGLCLGMQVATIEFARNVCGIPNANSRSSTRHRPTL